MDSLNPYWSSHSYGSQGDSTTTGTDISEALASLSLPSTLGDRGLMGMNYVQDREWTEDGKNYDATYGYYIGSMSATSGYISAENNASPWEESDKERQPPLTKLSDVYFLRWQDIASRKQLRNLKYFFRLHVINTQSKAIAAQAFGGEPVPRWPGRSFDLSTDEGLAILGTPNGAGVAWFLINHKPELGVRAPNKVTVFSTLAQDAYGQPEDWIHFLFYIAPVSNPST
ncbi:hypothetical protein N7509_003866 [Penicillium cosmopolitanum]|uniref:Uncharacterized protein n=1 Tax=Penicillium cosmopolitanum TaxID=1131564 RepID=A0A9W9W5U3_9EURO|nr:uncharacterized protein N7509_003866 [Penicillium cosmopolitanum]KAJ5403995.1 hypothetical protein N7509_003866 [Penicillium cosmopolitanum]